MGDGAAWPVQGLIRHFRPQIIERIKQNSENPTNFDPMKRSRPWFPMQSDDGNFLPEDLSKRTKPLVTPKSDAIGSLSETLHRDEKPIFKEAIQMKEEKPIFKDTLSKETVPYHKTEFHEESAAASDKAE